LANFPATIPSYLLIASECRSMLAPLGLETGGRPEKRRRSVHAGPDT
jgi:hypothetical protein